MTIIVEADDMFLRNIGNKPFDAVTAAEFQRVWGIAFRKVARPEVETIPEGCTPADAMVLREGNAVLAEENHNLRRCLRFYANGDHYTGLLHWEGPSGDDNWLCPPMGEDSIFADDRREFVEKMDEAMVEDGSIARATLISGKFEVEDPADEPKVVKGEPEWHIEQAAKNEPPPQKSSAQEGQ